MEMKKNKSVFLDRDGTINVDKHYLWNVTDIEYIDGAKEALRMLQEMGYLLVIITNQSGIARGYFSESDYKRVEQWMLQDLLKDGIRIAGCYYCPHHPNAKALAYRKKCNCRKPKLGLYECAVKEHNLDVCRSIAIGDKMRDLAICARGAKGYLLYTGKDCERGNIRCIKGGLHEAAKMIVEKNEHEELDRKNN